MTGKADWSGGQAGQDLRRRAEEMAREKAAQAPENLEARSPELTGQLLHELRVHQIELEMQNEELRRAQVELDAARARYFDLYDLAPVGYCTLSESGLILEANLTATTLLDVPRDTLIKQPMTRFILREDQEIYYLHQKRLFETGAPLAFDLRMVRTDGTTFWAHLDTNAAQAADGEPVCQFVLSDVTAQRRAEEESHRQLDELQRWHDVLLDREDRVQELKREVNELCRRVGEAARYPSQEALPEDSDTTEPKP